MSTCENCGKTFVPKPSSKAKRFCTIECYHQAGRRGNRKTKVKGVRMTSRPDHPLAPASGLIALHRIVLYDKIGAGSHPCHWCGKKLEWGNGRKPHLIVVDHVDHDKENNDPANLVPSCRACNAHRTKAGTRALISDDDPAPILTLSNGSRTRGMWRQCVNCGVWFIAVPAHVRKGQARFCSRACIYRR